METADLTLRCGIALLIGVLIGLEREYARLREELKSFVTTIPQKTRKNPQLNPQTQRNTEHMFYRLEQASCSMATRQRSAGHLAPRSVVVHKPASDRPSVSLAVCSTGLSRC